MQERKRPVEESDESAAPAAAGPAQSSEPAAGGFGAFADVYRARWAANHPQMTRRESTQPPTPAANVPRLVSEDGMRVFRPRDTV